MRLAIDYVVDMGIAPITMRVFAIQRGMLHQIVRRVTTINLSIEVFPIFIFLS